MGAVTSRCLALLFAAAVPFGAAAANPATFEKLLIGGGVSESVNGGLDIDASGNLDSSGYLSGASVKLRNGSYRATITWPTATGNRAITFPDAAGEVSLLGQTISSAEIVDATIAAGDLANDSVTSAKILNGEIVNADIASGANIAASKISIGAGTNDQVMTIVGGVWAPAAPAGLTEVALWDILQSGASTGHLPIWGGTAWAPGFIASANITDGTIVAADIATSGVATAEILNATILAEDLATGAVTTTGILDATIAAADLASNSVTSAKILDDEIVNADLDAAANIGLGKLDTAAGTNGQVMTKVAGVWAAADASSVSGAVTGPGALVDNAIARMTGTAGYTIQGYSSDTPTISDAGLMEVPGGITVDGAIISVEDGTLAFYDTSYLKFLRTSENRWQVTHTAGVETGVSGETGLLITAFDNDGNSLRDVMQLNRTASEGVIFGTNTSPSPIYVKGDIYAHTTDAQIVDDGKVLLAALAQTSATTGQVMAWNGSVWAPSSSGTGNVSNAGAGTDNSVARFNASGTVIQESQVIIDDSGNLDAAGTLTAGSANTVLTASTGIILDAALSSTVANLDQAETIAGNWVNTTNPWADNEVADTLTIGSGSTMSAPPAIGGVTPAAGAFTTLTTKGDLTIQDTTPSYQTYIRTGVSVSGLNPGTTSVASQWESELGQHSVFDVLANDADDAFAVRFDTNNNGSADEITLNLKYGSLTLAATANLNEAVNLNGATTIGDAVADTLHINPSSITLEGDAADANEITITTAALGADYTQTLPAKSGTFAMTSDIAAQLINTNITSTGNVGAGEDDLMTHSVAAGKLATNKDSLYFEKYFGVSNGVAGTQIRIYFGATLIFDTGAFTPASDGVVLVTGRIWRVTSTTQTTRCAYVSTVAISGAAAIQQAAPGETLSGAITLKATGVGVTNNDTEQYDDLVRYDQTP